MQSWPCELKKLNIPHAAHNTHLGEAAFEPCPGLDQQGNEAKR